MLCQYAFVSRTHRAIQSLFDFLLQWGSAFLLTGDLREQKKHLEVYIACVAFCCAFCFALRAIAFQAAAMCIQCRPW